MCGRFGLFAELDELAEEFNFDPSIMQDIYHPRWNIPPTVPMLSVHRNEGSASGGTRARLLRWGMAAGRSASRPKPSRPLFNARGETVHELPSFRESFATRRCLIPANGFYEWKRDESGSRTPVWFHREDAAPVAFAAIWTDGHAADDRTDSCAIITCAANGLVSPIHSRMPVLLLPESYGEWLNPGADIDALRELVQPTEWHDMAYYHVSKGVNRAANDHPGLLEPIAATAQIPLII